VAGADEDLRRQLGEEREQLADAVATLRSELKDATDVGRRLRENLPVATVSALGLGFIASGGIGATVRLLLGRGGD
jgi:hypothetical protein